MIKIELEYNPYLLETKILFNGQRPRINSLVEKFTNAPLQKWIQRIPKIFFDEMNGYDFEIEFSGTDSDYEELACEFQKQNITNEQVRIFYKNHLNSRTDKVRKIHELLSWMELNRNRIFDFEAFKTMNAETLHQSYPYIVLNGNALKINETNKGGISIEYIADISELDNTDLNNTPVTICISRINMASFQSSIKELLQRDDVEEAQLFFLFDSSLDNKKIKRIIYDIGIKKCTEISDINDTKVQRYIETFPMTDYIHRNILLLRKTVSELSDYLEKESAECEMENKEIHVEIDKYDEILNKLKDVYSRFISRDNLEIPHNWIEINNGLERKISSWRKRKTKITNETEAFDEARRFEIDVNEYFKDFINILTKTVDQTIHEISQTHFRCYQSAEFDTGYSVMTTIPLNWDKALEDIQAADALRQEFNEEDPNQQNDFFKAIFGGGAKADEGLQKVYYMETWRKRMLEIIKPKCEELTQQLFNQVCEYEKNSAKEYIGHLEKLIENQSDLKAGAVSKLSDKEKMLQADMDWLTSMQDMLREIESA